VDVAARLLFQQVSVQGASPISVPAVGYDLIIETSPIDSQVIPLALDNENEEVAVPALETATANPTPLPPYRIGETIAVRAGPILDHNNHIVPDGTPARFTMSTRVESGGILRQVEATTVDGIARATFVIDKPGSVEISVASEPALESVVLQFEASDEGNVAVTVMVPVASATPEPILPTPTTAIDVSPWITPEGYPRLGGWLLTLLALFGSVGLVFWAVSKIVSVRWGVRWALITLIGGLLSYNYLALGSIGAANWIATEAGATGVLVLTFIGELLGGIVAWVWMRWLSEPASRED
jgi:beta-N-acetylhexosaminidase